MRKKGELRMGQVFEVVAQCGEEGETSEGGNGSTRVEMFEVSRVRHKALRRSVQQ